MEAQLDVMDRLAVMRSAAKRVPPVIAGIAVLLCTDAALVGLGWLAASEAPLSVDRIAASDWTLPKSRRAVHCHEARSDG